MRRAWCDSQWPWIQKLIVHFDNRNQTLFDKEANLDKNSPNAASWATRLRLLYKLFEGAFDSFTLTKRPAMKRVRQRIALAQATSPGLYDELVNLYVTSSRMVKIWQELNRIRSAFLSNYLSLSPVLRVEYWSSPPKNLSEFAVPEKNFNQLRQLYVDCFETLCRLTVLAVGLEAIIYHKSLDVPTTKGQMKLWDYEAMSNGNKHTILGKYPIQDLFVPVIDHKLRNGIGHHLAVYVPTTDEVVYYKQDGETLQENRISYTEFVFKVLQIFSVVELAALYFHPLHVKACEAE
jgi:hypothetical protein